MSKIKEGDIYRRNKENFIVLGAKEVNEALTFQYILRQVHIFVPVYCIKYKDREKSKGLDRIMEHGKVVELDSDFIENNMSYSETVDLSIYSVLVIKRQLLGEIPPNLISIEDYYTNTYTLYKTTLNRILEDIRTIEIGTVFYYKTLNENRIYAGLNKYGCLTFYDTNFVFLSSSYEYFKEHYIATNNIVELAKKDRKNTVDKFIKLRRLEF